MRYMIIVKATPESEAGCMPGDDLLSAMADYHGELARAGVLLDASGLHPSSQGWRIRYQGTERSIVDGPFTESKEMIAGYTMISVRTPEEALEWARRFPNPRGEGLEAEIEVRRVFELDDFPQSETLERFRALEAGQASAQSY
ncbi:MULTISPECIES: YciI family protein [unclassified Massilia]|uniref:YciI family protein n=1 Tax=unclassified Massilia TaxID=2609279 RepID=UPI0017824B1E|nr:MULTISPECIES: YciI family protein [unclassified Massilia]MBD8528638.1 YciI family protein [Massilia sp. CFBP 13647]MBD8671739.1 YciI family protein [Massilia sp. CFBP 13721]